MLQRRVTSEMVKLSKSVSKGGTVCPNSSRRGMWECYTAYCARKLHLRVEKPCKQDKKLAECCLEGPDVSVQNSGSFDQAAS